MEECGLHVYMRLLHILRITLRLRLTFIDHTQVPLDKESLAQALPPLLAQVMKLRDYPGAFCALCHTIAFRCLGQGKPRAGFATKACAIYECA